MWGTGVEKECGDGEGELSELGAAGEEGVAKEVEVR